MVTKSYRLTQHNLCIYYISPIYQSPLCNSKHMDFITSLFSFFTLNIYNTNTSPIFQYPCIKVHKVVIELSKWVLAHELTHSSYQNVGLDY